MPANTLADPAASRSPLPVQLPDRTPGRRVPDQLVRLRPRLRCPQCSGKLLISGDRLECEPGNHTFPIDAGIPRLAAYGAAETWTPESLTESSVDYQQQYRELAAATRYNDAYSRKVTKRWSTERELALLDELLGSQPKCETLLNIPSGGGRLSDKIAESTETLIEADTAVGQLLYARERSPVQRTRLWMTASAFHIPFADASVDAAVCIRLCHHLPTTIERERLVAELLRVTRRYVVMTFFDYHSPKNYLRRLRAPFNGKPPKMTMTRARVAELATQHGAELIAAPALAWQSSGHRYALLVKPART